MIYSRNDLNSMPEQVQENMDNIEALHEMLENIQEIVVKGKKIWTNEDPSSAFTTQVVSLDGFEEYSKFDIIFAEATNSNKTIVVPFTRDYETQGQILAINNGVSVYYERGVEYDSLNNEIAFRTATTNNIPNGTYATDDTKMIPLAIIGYKTEIEE